MPFRCKCGRTFEKTDSFSSHTSSCAPFHKRRLSDATQYQRRLSDTASGINFAQQQQQNNLIGTPFLPIANNNRSKNGNNTGTMLSSSAPEDVFFMPTALSIQNAFEDATRRKSTSQESELKQ